MQYDIYLVIGIVILLFTIPSVLSAISDGHAPRVASILLLIGGGLVALAVTQHPGGYTIEDVPHAFVRVVARFMP